MPSTHLLCSPQPPGGMGTTPLGPGSWQFLSLAPFCFILSQKCMFPGFPTKIGKPRSLHFQTLKVDIW